MTTINTIEDLIRVLDENPHWLEALRARLLTRELLELPEKFAQFVVATEKRFDKVEQRLDKVEQRLDKVEQRLDKVEQRLDKVEQRLDKVEQRLDKVEQRLDKVEQRLDKVEQRLDKVEQRLDKVEQRLDKVEQRLDRVETELKSLRDDIAPLKGAHALNAALREADLIAEDLGLTLVQILNQEKIRAIVQSQNVSDIPANELRSFRRADLLMEATDQAGETCYIAVEVSFTANGRDTTRAVRNARFLTGFTGKRCYAAVAGLHRDRRIQASIESDEVTWYQLDPQVLEAE